MRTVFGRGLLVLTLWCLCIVVGAQQQSESSTTSSKDDKTSSSTSVTVKSYSSDTRPTTCQSGTVNYITHSLPQQCLSRSSNTTSSTATSDSTSTQPPTTTTPSLEIPDTSTLTSELTPSATQPSESETEADSPLDNSNFLSFEEWKNQNLAKVGQSPEHVGQQSRDKPPRNMPQINNALDVLGDDSEIELDFSGFGRKQDNPESSNTNAPAPVSTGPAMRSRDAGKTCKERSNYASFDCAATVLKSNPESKSASAVLIENKDSYMLNICSSSNKFLILELCDDILIDTIVLANYEFFSSIFRTFRVSVSDRYPVKQDRWKSLGVFEARNTRSVQAFLVEQPLIWARYLRIEFLTHYGNEYYCPVSLLRVHGTTMMEEFRHQEELARGEISDDLEESVMPDASESLPQEPAQSSKEADNSAVVESVTPIKFSSPTSTTVSTTSPHQSESASPASNEISSHATSEQPVSAIDNSSISQSSTPLSSTAVSVFQAISSKIIPPVSNSTQAVQNASTQSAPTGNSISSTLGPSKDSSVISSTPDTSAPSSTHSTRTNVTESASAMSSISSNSSSEPGTKILSSESTSQPTANATTSKGASPSNKPSSSLPESQQKPGTSTALAAPPNPTTQESFFKSIHKRLQMLESNATLSLQYIEEQSRILRDAFIKVEKRQIKKTESFLENLNATVFAELQDLKQQYDQLWQSTVIELGNHREQYEREILAVSARLSIVADELVFQKRMAIVQSTLLMLCLGLVLFVRAGSGAGLDIPIIQQMVNKSQLGRRSSYYSPLNSPSPDQTSPPNSSREFGRRRSFWRSSPDTTVSTRPTSRGNGAFSEASLEEHTHRGNPDLRFEPPTPTYSRSNAGDSEMDGEDGILVSPTTSLMHEGSLVDQGLESEDDHSLPPQETQSSPSTPSGSRDQQTTLKMLPAWPSTSHTTEYSNDDPVQAAKELEPDDRDRTPQGDKTTAPI